MLTILPLLLVGLGLAFFVGNDGDDSTSSPDNGGDGGEENPGEGDLLQGTSGDDNLVIDGRAEEPISAFAGNDTVLVTGGDDYSIRLGAGDDSITLGAGQSTVLGGEGNDIVNGGSGPGTVFLDEGDDTLNAGPGGWVASGGDGNDDLNGGSGNDTFDGGQGQDSIAGGDGDDSLSGGFGNDGLLGGAGNDFLVGDFGDDSLTGGGGQDTLFDNDGMSELRGFTGNDVLNAAGSEDGDGGQLLDGGTGGDQFFADQGDTVVGGDGKDTVTILTGTGDSALDPVQVLDFEHNRELLVLAVDLQDFGDPQSEDFFIDVTTQDSPDGLEVSIDGTVYAVLAGVTTDDTLTIEIVAENGGDYTPLEFLQLRDAQNSFDGTDNSETVNGGDTRDVLNGNGDKDVLNGREGNDTLNGGDGDDTLTGGEGDDQILGGDGDDRIIDLSGSNIIFGEAGNDFINSVAEPLFSEPGQASSIDGGSGNDTIYIDDGDQVSGGAGSDEFVLFTNGALDPVVINDFDIGSESLDIFVDIPVALAAMGPTTTSVIVAPGGNALQILLNTPDGAQSIVAELSGLTTPVNIPGDLTIRPQL